MHPVSREEGHKTKRTLKGIMNQSGIPKEEWQNK